MIENNTSRLMYGILGALFLIVVLGLLLYYNNVLPGMVHSYNTSHTRY
mgnify:CR=1 FL=1